MSAEAIKALFRRFIDDIDRGNLAIIDPIADAKTNPPGHLQLARRLGKALHEIRCLPSNRRRRLA